MCFGGAVDHAVPAVLGDSDRCEHRGLSISGGGIMQMLLGWDTTTWRRARAWARSSGLKRTKTIIPQVSRKLSETDIWSLAIAGMSLKDAMFVREEWVMRGGPDSGPGQLTA